MFKYLHNKRINSHEKVIGLLLAVYFFMTFFEPYINELVGSLMKYYVIFAILAIFIIYRKVEIKKTNISLLFIPWIIYRCITIFWSRDTTIVSDYLFGVILMVILTYLLSSRPFHKDTIRLFINAILLGSLLIGILSLFFHNSYSYEYRQTLFLYGVTLDPNNQAIFLTCGFSIALYRLFVEKNNFLYKFFYLLVCLVTVYSCFMTGSRGGLFGILAVIVAFILMNRMKFSKRIITLALLVFAMAVGFKVISNYLNADTFERLFAFEEYGGGSERTTIWSNDISLLNSNPLYYVFGAGWGSYWGYAGIYRVLHNTYLSMLSDCGIIGSLLFYIPIIKSIIMNYKEKELLPILILVSAFVPCFFLEALNKRLFWTPIMIIFIYATYHQHSEKVCKKEKSYVSSQGLKSVGVRL